MQEIVSAIRGRDLTALSRCAFQQTLLELDPRSGLSLLQLAVEARCPQILGHLLKTHKLGVDQLDHSNQTWPLATAARLNAVDCIQVLVEVGGANPLFTNKHGQDVFHVAAESMTAETAQHLIKAGANPCLKLREGQPLHKAISSGNKGLAEYLAEHGYFDWNTKALKGQTLLALALQHDMGGLVSLFLRTRKSGIENLVENKHRRRIIEKLAIQCRHD